MKNYVQPGMNIEVEAPAALASGDGVLIGKLFGVASGSAESGDSVVLATEGVFELPKKTGAGESFAVGDGAFWDSAVSKLTSDDTKPLVGVAVSVAGTTAEVVKVKLI